MVSIISSELQIYLSSPTSLLVLDTSDDVATDDDNDNGEDHQKAFIEVSMCQVPFYVLYMH